MKYIRECSNLCCWFPSDKNEEKYFKRLDCPKRCGGVMMLVHNPAESIAAGLFPERKKIEDPR